MRWEGVEERRLRPTPDSERRERRAKEVTDALYTIGSLRSHPLPFVPPGGRRYAGRTKEGWDRKVSDKEKLFIDLLVGRSYRLLTRSLHSSYVMWEGREEPA